MSHPPPDSFEPLFDSSSEGQGNLSFTDILERLLRKEEQQRQEQQQSEAWVVSGSCTIAVQAGYAGEEWIS